eukprot:11205049-Lingulodinium_polyedra.AAC.1
MSLHGVRDAAANFQAVVKQTMLAAGYTVSRYKPRFSTTARGASDVRCTEAIPRPEEERRTR